MTVISGSAIMNNKIDIRFMMDINIYPYSPKYYVVFVFHNFKLANVNYHYFTKSSDEPI